MEAINGTVSDEQKAYNCQPCDRCGNPRFVHPQAILCSEQEPSNQDVLTSLADLHAKVDHLTDLMLRQVSFVDKLEEAVMSHPMARAMFGG